MPYFQLMQHRIQACASVCAIDNQNIVAGNCRTNETSAANKMKTSVSNLLETIGVFSSLSL